MNKKKIPPVELLNLDTGQIERFEWGGDGVIFIPEGRYEPTFPAPPEFESQAADTPLHDCTSDNEE